MREQIGDDNGKRQGIEKEHVQQLVIDSIQHLFFYSAHLPNFFFVNYTPSAAKSPNRGNRIVCKSKIANKTLNVVIEIHYHDKGEYEVTIMTAMCVDDFRVSDNQYAIEIEGRNSTLYKMINKKLEQILEI